LHHIKIDSLPKDIEPHLKEDELAVYTFCQELTTNKRVSDTTFERVRSLLNEQQITDLCFSMGTYHAVSLTLNVFDVPIPEG
jgi:4-carboxymuconolactone decarboxylase